MRKILLIEDEPGIAENISYALSTEAFECKHHSTGREGIEALEKSEFNLVVLDIGLPDISGIEVCKEIRSSSNIPIIFLTARSEEIDKIVGLEVGADDYMVKPFSPRELVARIKAILRRIGDPPTTKSDANTPLELDSKRKIAIFFGEKVELSHYEYEILAKLSSQPGWIYSRNKLIESIWEDPGMVTDRTVDAHVKSIRQKLKQVRDEEVIKTHRSQGYSLREIW